MTARATAHDHHHLGFAPAPRRAPLRVGVDAHTLGARKTGNETYVRGLLDGFAELGDGCAEFVWYHTAADVAPPPAVGRLRRVRPHTPLVRIPLSLPLALARDGIEVAHFTYVTPPVAPCPTVVTVHDISYEYHPEFFSPLFVARMHRQVPASIRRAAHVITISEFSKGQIVERYGVDPDHVTVTYLAAGDGFRRLTPEDARAALGGLTVPERFVLAVGNLQPRKNLARLLRAFAAVRQDHGRLEHRLLLVGQPAYRGSEIVALIDELRLGDAVALTGYVTSEQLVGLYNLAELFVYPSLYEGFGLPIVEAMACGAPVVTSRAACMPEVAGDAALLVDPLSEASIADALARALADADLRRTLAARGLLRARTFSWRDTAERTLGVYERCAAHRRG